MRLFISYARVDQPYCIQIVETLNVHEVWFDHRMHAGQKWWDEILRQLSWCEGFIYLLSPESVKSPYCQKEYAIAQNLGKFIFPVLIQPNTSIPAALQDIQYVDLSNGLEARAVSVLLNSIYMAEREGRMKPPDVQVSRKLLQAPPFDPVTAIPEAAAALDRGEFDRAVFLLKQAQSHGYEPRFINLSAMLEEAESALNQQAYMREVEREYDTIVTLLRQKRTYKVGYEAFLAFHANFPHYDPENLAALCLRALPALEWCDVPAGKVVVEQNRRKTTHRLPAFRISKYPVTNEQYQSFIDAPDGYQDDRWWNYAPHVLQWHHNNPVPLPPAFPGDLHPRSNLTWYEAMAFCRWLGSKTGLPITLPSEVQWIRAAQGDGGRAFPWGRRFDVSRCNTRESGFRSTTPVDCYPGGVSPYGVYDMIGNVWEWCLTWRAIQENGSDGEVGRMVRGGSFVSPQDRSDINSYFILKPVYRYASIGFRPMYTLE